MKRKEKEKKKKKERDKRHRCREFSTYTLGVPGALGLEKSRKAAWRK